MAMLAMGMTLSLRRASEIEMARYARRGIDPEELLGNASLSTSTMLMRNQHVRAWLRSQAGASPEADAIADQIEERRTAIERFLPRLSTPSAAPRLDLHKSWHVLHFLLTGKAWDGPMPAATLLGGGREIGPDLGYGRPRIVTSEDAKDFAAHLNGVEAPALIEALDRDALFAAQIYGAENGLRSLAADVEDSLARLKRYLEQTVALRQGLLIWLQ